MIELQETDWYKFPVTFIYHSNIDRLIELKFELRISFQCQCFTDNPYVALSMEYSDWDTDAILFPEYVEINFFPKNINFNENVLKHYGYEWAIETNGSWKSIFELQQLKRDSIIIESGMMLYSRIKFNEFKKHLVDEETEQIKIIIQYARHNGLKNSSWYQLQTKGIYYISYILYILYIIYFVLYLSFR